MLSDVYSCQACRLAPFDLIELPFHEISSLGKNRGLKENFLSFTFVDEGIILKLLESLNHSMAAIFDGLTGKFLKGHSTYHLPTQ